MTTIPQAAVWSRGCGRPEALCPNVFRVYRDESHLSFGEQLGACYSQWLADHRRPETGVPVLLRVFFAADEKRERIGRLLALEQQFSANEIPVSFIPQAPRLPALLILEAEFVAPEIPLDYGQTEGIRYSVARCATHTEYRFAAHFPDRNGHFGSARESFSRMKQAYDRLGLSFNQIVRQWNYVGDIYRTNEQHHQYYQLFNEARRSYYGQYRTAPGYPAATGIGMAASGVAIESIALLSTGNVHAVAVKNPLQSDAFRYGQQVLVGKPSAGNRSNQTPLFERARLIGCGSHSRLYISGTAAITGQETVAPGDVAEQTRVTIENLAAVSAPENLGAHYPLLAQAPDSYRLVRVYVKNEADIPVVESICGAHFGPVPMTIVCADICRENLLVEIEAEMHSA